MTTLTNRTDYANFTDINDVYYLIEKRRQYYAISVPILLAYSTAVFCLNAGVLLVVPFIRKTLSPTLKLVVSLGVADLWTSVTLSVSLTYNSYLYFVHDVTTSACVAIVLEALKLGGFFSSIFHLFALALNHYLMTVRPFAYRKLMTSQNSLRLILAFAWTLPSAVIMVGFASVPGQAFQTPGGACTNLSFANTFEFRMLILCVICMFFATITILYAAVVGSVRRGAFRKRLFRGDTTVVASRQNRRTIATTMLMCGTFFIGWLPSSLMYFLMCSKCPYNFTNRNMFDTVYVFGFLSNFFILSKCLVNPVVYAVRIPEIRQVLISWKTKLFFNNFLTNNSCSNDFNENNGEDKVRGNKCAYVSELLVTTGQESEDPVKVNVILVRKNTKGSVSV